MTGKGRELADMMERRNVDTLCLQKTKWKESKVRNIGGAVNYSTMELMVKNGIKTVVREELFESVLEVKRVSDRLMAMKLQVKRIDTKHSKCLCSLGWQQHGGEK